MEASVQKKVMVDTRTKITRVAGLLGTGDLTLKAQQFVAKLERLQKEADAQKRLLVLSDAQIDWLDDLYTEHFA